MELNIPSLKNLIQGRSNEYRKEQSALSNLAPGDNSMVSLANPLPASAGILYGDWFMSQLCHFPSISFLWLREAVEDGPKPWDLAVM